MQLFTCTTSIDFPGCLRLAPRAVAGQKPQLLLGKWDRVSPALGYFARGLLLATGVRGAQRSLNRPTTGFIAVLVALHVCDTTRIFGFGMTKPDHASWSVATSPTRGQALSCASYRDALLVDGRMSFNETGCRTPRHYEASRIHNYAAEQEWLRRLTRDGTRRALTCADLPRAEPRGNGSGLEIG